LQEISLRIRPVKLPGSEKAVVAERKISGYLLSLRHPTGRNKALWLTEYGFTPETLGEALRHHAAAHDVARIEESPFGKRFVIEGTLVTLDGRNPPVRSIWFIETGDDAPRLVTLYPLRRSDT
jgi:hypothetical protein